MDLPQMKINQSEIIAKYFENIFYANPTPMQNVLPTPMSTLFTSSEIRKAVCTLKNKIKAPEWIKLTKN